MRHVSASTLAALYDDGSEQPRGLESNSRVGCCRSLQSKGADRGGRSKPGRSVKLSIDTSVLTGRP